MEKLMQTPHAVAIYLDLLVEIHREIVATKVRNPDLALALTPTLSS